MINDPYYNNSIKIKSTPAYMAPEAIYNILNKDCKVELLDSWSFGCIIYELVYAKPLFLKAKGIQQLGSMIYRLY